MATPQAAGRSLRSGLPSDLLLYASLALTSPLLAALGAIASPLLWFASVQRRNVALLIACTVAALGLRIAFLEHWAVVALHGLLPLPAAVGFLIRPSAVALVLLLRDGDKRLRLALWMNAALVALALASVQLLAWKRSDVADVGYVLLTFAVSAEVLNAWALWHFRSIVATDRLARIAVVVAVIGIATLPPLRTRARSDVTMWWPAKGQQEFATVNNGFGWNNIGHFGELPLLLRKGGYTVALRSDLENVSGSIIVVPVPVRSLRSTEVEALRGAVVGGSRLLLIAEHTNLDGVRDSYNAILAGTGLEVHFDTTNGIFGDSVLSLSGHLLRTASHITHNRGASLAVKDPRPRVLLKGGWWHSDVGDPLSPEDGYLSDYRLSPGDRLGNVVLAAKTRLGQGEIIVWGDGSPFLNQNLAYNSRFLFALLSELGGNDRLPWVVPTGAAIFLLLWLVTRRPEVVGITVLLALGLPLRSSPVVAMPTDLAVISDEENNGFDRDAFSPNSVTGLGVVLTRSGLVPSIGAWSSRHGEFRIIFVINPQRAITDRYARRLADLASKGTTVVISGAGDNRTFRKLAQFFGSEIVGHPQGNLTGSEFTTYSAWRLTSTKGQVLKAGDVEVGTIIAVGSGRVVLIADGGFFLSRNLETETFFDAKNLAFISKLVGER